MTDRSEFTPKPFGRYYLLDLLEVGGLAEIYVGALRGTSGFEKLLAIKQLHRGFMHNEQMIKMLIDEAKIVVNLSHPNIVHVFELNQHEGVHYIVMEYVEGLDLRQLLKKIKRGEGLPVEMAIFITREVLRGLDYAHRKTDRNNNPLNIVHRDISPPNILISCTGEVKITDFGIARATGKSHETQVGTLKGKIAYMSPEQAAGKEVDARSDLFAVGIVLFEMLTGETPFEGKTDIETIQKVQKAKFQIPENIPRKLSAILNRFLAKDVNERFQSAKEAETAISQLAFESLPPTSGEDLAKLVRDLAPQKLSDRERLKKKIELAREREKTKITSPADQKRFLGGSQKKEWYLRRPFLMAWGALLILGSILAVATLMKNVDEKSEVSIPPTPSLLGTLEVKTEPPGANLKIIYLDREISKKSPAVVSQIPIGSDPTELRITASKDGFSPVTATAFLSDQKPDGSLLITLKPHQYGYLDIRANPWGRVTIENHLIGKETPFPKVRIPAGIHEVKITYPPADRKVIEKIRVSADKTTRCLVNFAIESPRLECHQAEN